MSDAIGQRSCRYPTPVGSAAGAEEAEVGEHRQLRRQRPHEVVGEELKLGHATISAHDPLPAAMGRCRSASLLVS